MLGRFPRSDGIVSNRCAEYPLFGGKCSGITRRGSRDEISVEGKTTLRRLIDALVQIPQDARGHAPDVTLAERHGVVLALDAFPVAAVQCVVLDVHQEAERHFE